MSASEQFWFTEKPSLRLVGSLLFFLPGLILVVWGLMELNNDPKFLLVEAIGWLMIFTFIVRCLRSEGFNEGFQKNQFCFWKGFTIPYLNINWRNQKVLLASSIKVQVFSQKVDENISVYLIRVQGKEQGSQKLVRWDYGRQFPDRSSARSLVKEIRKIFAR